MAHRAGRPYEYAVYYKEDTGREYGLRIFLSCRKFSNKKEAITFTKEKNGILTGLYAGNIIRDCWK